MKLVKAAMLLALASAPAAAQVNAGNQAPEPSVPFTLTQVATFNLPWRMAFLPDGRMLVTEKVGPLWLVTADGKMKRPVQNYPAVLYGGQGGMLGVYVSPNFASDQSINLTYSEHGTIGGISGSSLALAKARLVLNDSATPATASLEDLKVIWRDGERGRGGQFGAALAFAPDGNSLFLTSGDRQRFTPAQDPNQPLGKVLHLTLDGKPAPDNPMAGKTGAASVGVINPPADTEAAKTATVVYTYTFPGKNMTPAETWSTGHRTPYGLAFGPDGRLWEAEHGPRGGDELNRIQKGKNYGWPLITHGIDYPGGPIADGLTAKPGLEQPVYYWDPVIAPSGLAFYSGNLFPEWRGSVFVGGLAGMMLDRLTIVNDKVVAEEPLLTDLHSRIRDVRAGPDGAVYV